MLPQNIVPFHSRGLTAAILTLIAGYAVSARADVFTQVPEAAADGYQLLYTLPVVDDADYGKTEPAYSVDKSASLTGAISRVAFYMELQTTSDAPIQYAYASMDAFTENTKFLGLPTAGSGAYFNQSVYNMHVFSNVPGITTGPAPTGGLEFFCSNYQGENVANAPNASDSALDWSDNPSGPHGGGGYGSFQIANPLKSQEIICYGSWGGDGGHGDIGLGNGKDNLDWSFAHNAPSYKIKNIQVLVKLGSPPARIQIMPLGDSITYGWRSSATPGGYRTPLYSALAATGRTYDFVGSTGAGTPSTSGVLFSAAEQQHEGHNGYKIDQLTNNIAGDDKSPGNDGGYWLKDNPGLQPKYILLQIGTNDINGNYDPTMVAPTEPRFVEDMIGRLKSLLNAIIDQRPHAHILLAGIIPIKTSAANLARTKLYNEDIQTMVINDPDYKGKLTYVDQHSSFLNTNGAPKAELYADDLHPNDAGYQVMATNWFNAINTLDARLSASPASAH